MLIAQVDDRTGWGHLDGLVVKSAVVEFFGIFRTTTLLLIFNKVVGLILFEPTKLLSNPSFSHGI